MRTFDEEPEEEEVNDEDLGIDGDEEYLNFNYPIASKLKEDAEAGKEEPLDDEDLGDGKEE